MSYDDGINVFKRNAHENQCLTFGKIKLCEYDEKGITNVLHEFNRWRCTTFDRADNTLNGDLYLSLDRNGVHLRSLDRLKYLKLVVGTYSKRIDYPRDTTFVDHETKIAVLEHTPNYKLKKIHILDLETNKFLHNLLYEEALQVIPQYVEEIVLRTNSPNYFTIP